MNRTAIIKTSAAFLGGIAFCATSITLWLDMADQADLRAFLNQRPLSKSSRHWSSPDLWSKDFATPDFGFASAQPKFALVPLSPDFTMGKEDFASLCVDYMDGGFVALHFFPTKDLENKLKTFAENSLDSSGFSPKYLLMSDEFTVHAPWQTSRETILEFENDAERYADSEYRKYMTSINISFQHPYLADAFFMMSDWTDENDISVCSPEHYPDAQASLEAHAERFLGKVGAAKLFTSPTKAPSQ